MSFARKIKRNNLAHVGKTSFYDKGKRNFGHANCRGLSPKIFGGEYAHGIKLTVGSKKPKTHSLDVYHT